MSATEPRRRFVRIEMEIRVTFPAKPGTLAAVLGLLRQAGGSILAHFVYRVREDHVGLFVCENPTEGAATLQRKGFTVETETVVLAEAERSPDGLAHLVQTLEAEGVDVLYSYAASSCEDLLVVFRTADNPKAEAVLRSYLIPGEPGPPAMF